MKIKLIIIYIIIVIILCVINYKLSSKDIDPSEKTNVINQDNLNDINYSDGLNDSDNLDKINDTNDLNNTNNLSADDLSTVSIDRLLQLCITESDNIAYNMLNRICGNTIIDYANNNICSNCLIDDNGYLKTSAKSIYQILYRLYFSQDNSYAKIIDYMKHTQFNDSLNKYLPEGRGAHKIGSYYRYYHDASIIYGDETYILVVMTKDLGILTESTDLTPDQEERYLVDWGSEAFESMAQLSQEIYKAK